MAPSAPDRPRISFTFLLDLSGPLGPSTLQAFRAAIGPLVEGRANPDGRLGVVALHGKAADVMVPPTGSAERARRQLAGFEVDATALSAAAIAAKDDRWSPPRRAPRRKPS